MDPQERVAIFHDTLQKIKKHQFDIKSYKYKIDDLLAFKFKRNNKPLKVSILKMTTTEAILSLPSDKNICALNFANRFSPGGGVQKGSKAQEEDLCRTSSLFSALISEKFYPYIWTNDLIYTDKVVFIKNDTYQDVSPKYASIITASAPDLARTRYKFYYSEKLNRNLNSDNINKTIDNILIRMPYQFIDLYNFVLAAKNRTLDRDIYDPFKNMIRASARAAIYHSYKTKGSFKNYLILGAIGLGAFRLNPDIEKLLLAGGYLDIPYDKKIALLFLEALVEDNIFSKYDEIIFAIPKTAVGDMNYDTFVKVFSEINQQVKIFDLTIG